MGTINSRPPKADVPFILSKVARSTESCIVIGLPESVGKMTLSFSLGITRCVRP